MTQTQRKQQPIELAPNQIYLKRPGVCNPIQTLVEGYQDWSFFQLKTIHTVILYHKGRNVTTLIALDTGGYVDERLKKRYPHSWWQTTPPPQYASLTEAVQLYEQEPELLAYHDQWNKADGLEEWCVRQSFTPAKLSLKCELPPEERKRLTRLAKFDGHTLEEIALEALYKHLSAVEERYLSHQQWEQRQQVATPKSEIREEVSA